MSTPVRVPVGTVLSADVAVPEHDRVVQFYAQVLGTGTPPFWRKDLMNAAGTPIIGLGARTPQYAHLPLQWMPHIQVADVGASLARAVERGATELLHSQDAGGNSQWAVVLDPFGAAFGLIPCVPATAVPAGLLQGGCIRRITLTVPSPEAARDFYGAVVGWDIEPERNADGIESGDVRWGPDAGLCAGGIYAATHSRASSPAVWLIHLPVGDLAESLRLAESGGGTVLRVERGPTGQPVRAELRDPVGGCVALVEGTPPDAAA